MPVAVKILDLNGLPPDRAASLAKVYLNEVANLERLQRESRHVVVIYDFDFDPLYGIGDINLFSVSNAKYLLFFFV